MVEYIADQAAVMNRGRIEESGTAHTVLAGPRSDCCARCWQQCRGSARSLHAEGSEARRKKIVAGTQRGNVKRLRDKPARAPSIHGIA